MLSQVTLVPNVRNPNTVGEFRPISCCSVIFKCITKLLCEKLRLVLNDVVSETQGAFIQGRSILHNVFICQDLVKMCRRRHFIQKAYDTAEWGFLTGDDARARLS